MLAITCIANVSCAKAKVPAFTCEIEKAILPQPEVPATYHGAIIKPLNHSFTEGTFVEILALDKMWLVKDETFYRTGYKALLNKEVKEIFAPPDRHS